MITKFKSMSSMAFAASLALLSIGLFPPGAEARGLHNRYAAHSVQFGMDSSWSEARDASIAQIIDGDDYECSPGPLKQWQRDQLKDVYTLDSGFTLSLMADLLVFEWVTIYKAYLDSDDSDEYIGLHGQYTEELLERHQDAKRFWNVPTDDVQLMGLHGDLITDTDNMAFFLYLFFTKDDAGTVPLSPDEAYYIVGVVQTLIEGGEADLGPLLDENGELDTEGLDLSRDAVVTTLPGIAGDYGNPLLTFVAFAFSVQGVDIFGSGQIIPDKIGMGDGVLQGIKALGLEKNGPDTVHAHEFAHHVQFELGVISIFYPSTPESNRRSELMADGLGAYFLHHARGAAFQTKRITDAIRTIYSNGNCDFDSDGHHGTPSQRGAAAAWGAGVFDAAMNKGYIETASAMVEKFDEVLPILVAPDAN